MTRRLPAEWEPQQAVLLTWPRADGDFARWFGAVETCFIDIASAAARFQPVWISTAGDPEALRRRLLERGIDAARLRVLQQPSDDVWVRDHGPITVLDDEQAVHVDFRFNGWGGKFAAERDDALSAGLHARGLLPGALEAVDYVLEGGAIDVDGRGSLLTTEHCVLSDTRNGGTRADFEALVADRLGIARVLWLTRGGLAGDDTDGHVDTLARFCDAHTIVYQGCDNPDDEHHGELAAMRSELEALRRADGRPSVLHALPLPAAIRDEAGQRLPASYANFLIINGAVLAPTYRDPADAEALAVLGRCFPDREVVGVDCVPLIHQYGSLHCVTMQVPAAN